MRDRSQKGRRPFVGGRKSRERVAEAKKKRRRERGNEPTVQSSWLREVCLGVRKKGMCVRMRRGGKNYWGGMRRRRKRAYEEKRKEVHIAHTYGELKRHTLQSSSGGEGEGGRSGGGLRHNEMESKNILLLLREYECRSKGEEEERTTCI